MLRIGHRGAPAVAPPNTMASFEAAFNLGCDWVECDCRVSADGVIVLAHDAEVHTEDGARHPVAERTAAELARLDLGAGAGVPTLAELAEWAVERLGVFADIKVEGVEAAILDALTPLLWEGAIICGAGDDSRREFRRLAPDARLAITVNVAHQDELQRRWHEIDSYGVTFEYPLVTPERLADLHGRGILVFPWTVDDACAIRRLAEMGVDGIITNRPDLFIEL